MRASAQQGWRALAGVGADRSDSEDVALRKAVLVISSALTACLACVWVVTFTALGLWVAAAIPFAYQLLTVLGVGALHRTHRPRALQQSQLWLSLVLPFLLQWTLGGFRNASAVCLWAFICPLGALLFVGARRAAWWMVAFAGLLALSGAIDRPLAAHAPAIPAAVIVTFVVLNLTGVTATAYVLLLYFVRARDAERARSERLLLNVLPAPVAARLKRADGVFAAWDGLAAVHGVEKIKTIGDAYMVAAGIPAPRPDHAEAIAEMALAMGPALAAVAAATGVPLQARIGLDTGAAVAGVIGRARFSYDVWGDTVNTASRMQSHAPVGTIQVSERAGARLCRRYELIPRGTIEVKGKGPMSPYLLTGRRCES